MAKEIKEKNEKKKTNKRRRARRGKKKTQYISDIKKAKWLTFS